MSEGPKFREVLFRSEEDIWPNTDDGSTEKDSKRVSALYDPRDGTYLLTRHPGSVALVTSHFTQHQAMLALTKAGYTYRQSCSIMEEAYQQSKMTG